jgi:hypothetical protein
LWAGCRFQKLERSFTELADNGQWVIDNYNQTLHATEHSGAREESTLRFPVVTGQAA